ncbi:DNA polymerase III subunit delta' [Lihuaxuella thermophila]|uniref:DNA polymerase-3 subunit delta n=1 Tax=Lihuaxuella thermophila TaxID=1173111 RepID=A0A1H8I8K8_9BACL|nr:DNA polymerase III subunit delta' [Lihuaxuella thermophila]SEN64709.1 DNA polymerase-3 subunit delta' [Lihuaxuella thermophila]
MSFQEVKGQSQVIRLLQNGLLHGKIAHAYCFAGPRGVGKQKTAMELAKALNCEQKGADACDRCRSCLRIEHGNHPDVIRIKPDGASIKIDQVRQLQRAFSFSPGKEVVRVIMIEQADFMTPQAANSLLKFLEEPVSAMVAILITENIHAMLPTVLSRCQILRFSQLPPAILAKKLEEQGIRKDNARILAHLSQGEEEYQLLDQEEFAQLCRRVIEWNQEILSGKSSALVSIQREWLQKQTENERLPLVLDILLLWLRDLVHHHLNKTGKLDVSVFSEWEAAREEQAYRWNRSRLLLGMEAVLRARSQLAGPMQPQAVLEQMVLAMQEGSL